MTEHRQPSRRASTGAILLTSVCIQALLVSAFWYFEPLRKSTMSADKQAVEEELEEVKKRSEKRLEREKREREKKQLSKDDSEKLKDEEEHKRKRKVIEKIAEMEDLHKELEKLKEKAIEQLQEREAEEIAEQLASDLERQAEELKKRAAEADKQFDSETSERARELAEEIGKQAKALRDEPLKPTDELREKAGEMQERAAELEHQADSKGERKAAEHLQQAADRMADSARALANLNGEQESRAELEQQAAQLGEQLQQQSEQLQADADAAQEQFANQESQAAQQAAQQVGEESQQLGDNPQHNTEAMQEQLGQVEQQAGQLREQGGNNEQQRSAEQLARSAQAMQQTAQAMQDVQRQLGPQLPPSTQMQQMPIEQLHDMAQQVEQAVSEQFADLRAAELAMNQNRGFQEARDKISDLGSAAAEIPANLSQQEVGTVGELNQYREQLDQVVQSTTAMRNNAQNMANQAQGMAPQAGGQQQDQAGAQMQAAMSALQAAANGQMGRSVDMSGIKRRQMGQSSGGQGQPDETHAHKAHETDTGLSSQGIRQLQLKGLNEGRIKAEAMPGRMFTKNSKRTGWLFLDTWYVIGPWQAGFPGGKVDYSTIFPPEISIDLDATYKDGKQYRRGPRKGRHRELEWQFFQSSTLRTTPPDEQSDSVYYAYTEVFFEEDTDMLIAVGTDDAAKVWVNDMVVWQDDGLSAWSLQEGFRKVFFKKGHNTVLGRITNGPVVCQWSVLLCPAND